MNKIGIQGGKGSFSEQAAFRFLEKNNLKDFRVKYLINSESVLKEVENSKVNYGIFAMENAQGGVVICFRIRRFPKKQQ